jgi:GDP-L-fucose synthase
MSLNLHPSAPQSASTRELAGLIQRTVGHQGEIAFDDTKPDGTPRKLLDVSRLKGLGWSASTPLERGLRTAYAEFVATQA